MSTDVNLMNGYTKLFGSILASTIWEESKETRVCWITMLAMADRYGMVSSSIPGLATLSRLTIAETQAALEKLQSVDEFSRTKDFDGRRIEPCDGGWLILNHGKYREKIDEDERREYLAEAKRRSREKLSTNVNKCQHGQQKSTQAEAEAEAINTIARKKRTKGGGMELDGFAEWYEAYPRHVARANAAKAYETAVKAFMVRDKLERSAAVQALLDVTKRFSTSDAGIAGSFTPQPASWLNGQRFFDDPKDWKRTEPNGDKSRASKTNATGAERPSVPVPSFEETRAAMGPGQPRDA